MGIRIIKSGILATVQDLGRTGYGRFGVNRSGAIDTAAIRIANLLCGNAPGTAALEMHFPAPMIEFEESCWFALGGADFGARLNGNTIEPWRLFKADRGDILEFGERRFGARTYLAVRGGFRLGACLGSRSTNLKAEIGGFEGRTLMKGDRLVFDRPTSGVPPQLIASTRLIPFYSPFPTVRVVRGPEFELLTPGSRSALFDSNFEVSRRSDRMGFRLAGPGLRPDRPVEIVSSAVNFGTIQLLPDGQLIILMADHQTTGGYPRVATIIPSDLPLAAQVTTLGKIAFHEVSVAEAERLYFEFERDLKLFGTACKFRLDAAQSRS